jgi:hypothetical protein
MDNKNNFDFDKTFNNLFSLAKREFKDVDEHFLKVAIYGYIYSDLLGEKLDDKDNEDFKIAQKQYKITEHLNEDSLIKKSCDIQGESFNINKLNV